MNLTPKLKAWAVEKGLAQADASDDVFKKAIAGALSDGTLDAVKFAELSKVEEAEKGGELISVLKTISEGQTKLFEVLTTKPEEGKATETETKDTPSEDKSTATDLDKMVGSQGGTPTDPDEKEGTVRVKQAVERYDSTTKTMTYPQTTKSGKRHPMAGQPVKWFANEGRMINEPSRRDVAVMGSFAKFMVNASLKKSKTIGFATLPEHDQEILKWAMENMEWGGSSDGGNYSDINGKLTPSQQKALIDDSTSGGLEAAPIVFDDNVIQAPLLHGELFPLVNVVPLDRGRRVEGVSTGTVTGSWGGVDDTAISLFTTTSYVSAFDTTIYRWEGSIRIGLDFLSDTPIDFGAHVSSQYGERLLEDLDDVIATGNGTTQPEGVMNKSGITTVAWGGSTSIGNYESLRFGVAKPEHGANFGSSAVFCGNETSYQRARALAVGASDARRLFGMDYDSYSIMERPYKINESLANTQIFYAVLGRYRMYQRRGLTMRTSTEGDTLIRRNEILMAVTARYGGQMERAATGAVTTTAPA